MPVDLSMPALGRHARAACLHALLGLAAAVLPQAQPRAATAPAAASPGEPPRGLSTYEQPGPHRAESRPDLALTLRSRERVAGDLFRTDAPGAAPLVILVHGHDNGKADHAYQCMHLATWGLHCLALQVRNRGPWVGNGTLLARVVQQLRTHPGSIDAPFDPARIVLAGHSFGATSVIVALAGAPQARGGVLLDPADATGALPGHLRKIRAPVAIVGADERIEVARNRGIFRANLGGRVVEASVADARHEDAQFALAADIASAEPGQVRFLAALTLAARSVGETGRLDQVWAGFEMAAREGVMINLRRR